MSWLIFWKLQLTFHFGCWFGREVLISAVLIKETEWSDRYVWLVVVQGSQIYDVPFSFD